MIADEDFSPPVIVGAALLEQERFLVLLAPSDHGIYRWYGRLATVAQNHEVEGGIAEVPAALASFGKVFSVQTDERNLSRLQFVVLCPERAGGGLEELLGLVPVGRLGTTTVSAKLMRQIIVNIVEIRREFHDLLDGGALNLPQTGLPIGDAVPEFIVIRAVEMIGLRVYIVVWIEQRFSPVLASHVSIVWKHEQVHDDPMIPQIHADRAKTSPKLRIEPRQVILASANGLIGFVRVAQNRLDYAYPAMVDTMCLRPIRPYGVVRLVVLHKHMLEVTTESQYRPVIAGNIRQFGSMFFDLEPLSRCDAMR